MEKQGPTGCFFLLSDEPQIGSSIEMEITLPDEFGGSPLGKFLCHGKVVQVKKEDDGGRTGVHCSIDEYRLVPPPDNK